MEGRLKEILSEFSSAVVAFTGGVDSSVVAWGAGRFVRGKVLLATVVSPAVPEWDIEDARSIASFLSLPHRWIKSDVLEREEYVSNSPQRCYFCKTDIYFRLEEIRRQEGYGVILDGETKEDELDIRPGRRAAQEFFVVSPLRLAGFSKSEVRKLARKAGLPIAEKPASPCLSSRIPFFQTITLERLKRVERAESLIRSLGFSLVRLRDFFPIARLEFLKEEIPLAQSRLHHLQSILFALGYTELQIPSDGYQPMGLQFQKQRSVG